MTLTPSTMSLPLGAKAPDFQLPDPEGKRVSLEDFDGSSALLVIFMCNHCPFVQHVRQGLAEMARDFMARNIAVVGINANDVENYPEDRPERMAEEIRDSGYTFPYLYDASQEIAKAYRAACTPDFFLFDKDRKLVYRGQMDDSRPGSGVPITGKDLREAVNALLGDLPVPEDQKPSMGCNIKWKPGNEPDYFG